MLSRCVSKASTVRKTAKLRGSSAISTGSRAWGAQAGRLRRGQTEMNDGCRHDGRTSQLRTWSGLRSEISLLPSRCFHSSLLYPHSRASSRSCAFRRLLLAAAVRSAARRQPSSARAGCMVGEKMRCSIIAKTAQPWLSFHSGVRRIWSRTSFSPAHERIHGTHSPPK